MSRRSIAGAVCVAIPVVAMLACTSFGTVQPDASDGGGAAADASDGGGAADSGSPTFCASVDAAFCEDFDDGVSPWDFDEIEVDIGTTFAANTTTFTSAPRSGQVRLPELAGGFVGGVARALALVQGSVRGAQLELDWRIDKDSSTVTHAGSVLDVMIVQPDGVGGVALHHQVLVDGGVSYSIGQQFTPVRAPSIGAWHHVVLTIRFDGNDSGSIALVIDGETTSVPVGATAAVPQSSVRALLGGESAQRLTPPVWMSFDNIVLTLMP